MTAPLVSIIGPPAVGKTTLAELLADEWPARLIREDFQGNPFLAESYSGRETARLPAQLYYLMSRVSQLSQLTWPADGLVVTDYGFCQDRLFAQLRLSADEFALYRQVAGRLEPLVRPPTVLVRLDAAAETLLDRIARRGREFEKTMTAEFLTAMLDACRRVTGEADCAVIGVDCDEVDLLNASARSAVAERIRQCLRRAERETEATQ